MITVFHKAKHKLPSCKDVLARVLTLAAPVLQCLGDKFRPVVNANLFGSTPPLGELVEFANHPLTGQARIDSDRQDLPIEIVDDVECPEWLSLKKAVVNEVH